MQTKSIFLIAMLCSAGFSALAGSGNASDGLVFSLVLTGILVIIAAVFFLVDYFKKNAKRIFNSMIIQVHWLIRKIREYLHHRTSSFTLDNAPE